MKALALVVLFATLLACANAAATISVDGTAVAGNAYVHTRHTVAGGDTFSAPFTVTVTCDGAELENCTASNAAWTISGAGGSTPTGVVIDTTTDPDQVVVTPSANPPEKFILTYTAPNTTSGGPSLTRALVVFVTDARVYDAQPDVAGSFVATLVTNTPSRNLQYTPSLSPDFDSTSPYNFVRSGSGSRPSADVPLYWGNFYEIRLGLVADAGRYCGSNGTWPADTNDDDVEPVAPSPTPVAWNSTDFDPRGCSAYIEQGDTWTFPAPSQRIPREGSNGYDTVRPQTVPNPVSNTGPLVWSQRGAAGSALTFTGLTRPSNWVAQCTDNLNGAEFVNYPCIAPRYNPDPKVWIVSATGTQPARITAIGTSSVTLPTVTLNNQATPPVLIGQLYQTNEFVVTFEWPNIPTAISADTTAGIPAQGVLVNVPSCAGASFTPRDPAANNPPIGINFYPTCEQGLLTQTGCTPSATVANCLNSTDAATAGAAVGAAIITASGDALAGVWISQRPLQVLPNGAGAAVLNPGDGTARAVTLSFDSRQGTLPFTIGFPLDQAQAGTTGNTISENNWNAGANGSSITIRPRAVFECANEGDCLTTVGGAQNYQGGTLADFFGGSVPTFTINQANPTATVSFSNLPQPSAGSQWQMFFEVQDAATSTTSYPWSSLPYLVINVADIEVEFINFPPADGIFYITQPQANAPSSYNYQVRIKRSPRSLGLAQVVVDFDFFDATNPLQFFVNGTQISQFVFSEWQTVINFQVYTQQTPVGPFQMTFTDATGSTNSFLAINPGAASNLYVRANPINVKTQSGRLEGPYVGEPFFLELTFTPPATGSGFTVTASGASIAEQTVTATASATDSGILLGPLTPVLPNNIDLSVGSYQLPIALAVSGTQAYSIVSVITVTVYRHTFVVTNALNGDDFDDNDITLFTLGEPSVPYCITTKYPVFNSSLVTAGDSVSFTFASETTGNIPGLIFEPAVLVLSQANPRGCVTIRADRNFNWDSRQITYPAEYDVYAYLGGSLAAMFQNPEAEGVADTEFIWDFPHDVNVEKLALSVVLDPSSVTGQDDLYALGETVQLRVYTDVLPLTGLNYTIRASGGVTLTPSTAASNSVASHGRFAPATPGAPGQWQAWDVTFNGYAGDALGEGGARTVQFNLYVSAGDAAYYRSTGATPLLDAVASVTREVNVTKRGVFVDIDDTSIEVQSLVAGTATVLVYLQHPVINGLNVSLHARTTNGASSAGLSFSPSSVQFTPNGPNSHAFAVTGNLLGTYQLAVRLSGPDAEWFDLEDSDSDWQSISVGKRAAPTITSFLGDASGGVINAGVTYGPVGLVFPSPLQIGESVTITPSGSDFTFSPSSITLGPGQSQALFSFTYNSPSSAEKAVVFFTISGPSAWKYNTQLVRQEYDVSYSSFDVVFQSSAAVVPGVAHEGYITLPFAVSSNLIVTPLVLGAAVSFNPPQWTFTPTSGNVIHFTYTVNSVQAFDLSSTGTTSSGSGTNPSTTAASIQVAYLVNGTDAGLFAPVAPSAAFTVVRPSFNIDATYQSAAGKIINSNEQPGTVESKTSLFVVGKWSNLYSVHLSAAPASGSVTLTLSDTLNVIDFIVGDSDTVTQSATLTFTADNYVQYFRFRFNTLLTGDATYVGFQRLSVTVSGANAQYFDFSSIFNAFNGLAVIPALAFSPIPAIYTDGAATGLFVAVKSNTGAIGNAWPYADDAQFSLHIVPQHTTGVVVEPSTLEFSKSRQNDPVQSFSIHHTNPRVFETDRSYTLQWLLRYAGWTTTIDITSVVPQDAQQVLLSRYQVIPDFPHVLSYGWQKASFNLSYVPTAHISFIPRIPPVDGDSDVRGATTPAGRVDFEPAVIVAAPGQQVVEFQVKAQPGVDRDNLYYRVDWEMHGHTDDLVNFVEWLQVGATGLNNDGNIGFATWHLASGGVTTVSIALLAFVCVVSLVRNLF